MIELKNISKDFGSGEKADCDLPCIHKTALLTHNIVLPRQRVQRVEFDPHHSLLYRFSTKGRKTLHRRLCIPAHRLLMW